MTNQPSNEVAPQRAMMTGQAVNAFVPSTGPELVMISEKLARSGEMVPKEYRDKPDAIAAAIMQGMEVGLKPLQALKNIAVINGRATLWGDAVLALILNAGHDVDEKIEGQGDEMVATCTLTRGDNGKVITRTFSMEDAKRAGLLGKDTPWRSYPQRMVQMRARSWACRDGAADVMMGMQVAEEVRDYQPAKDVTPRTEQQGSSFAARKAALQPAVEDAATHDDASTAEDDNASKPPSQSTPEAKAEHGGEAGRGDPAPTEQEEDLAPEFVEGATDRVAGLKRSACPPDYSDDQKALWNAGYDSVAEDQE